MIKVNLLPPEYRKIERTPILRFVTILCGVVLSASAIGAFLYVHFGELVTVTSEAEKLEANYNQIDRKAKESQALAREAAEYKKRRDTINQVGRNRLLWSKKLDELCDVIQNKGDTKRYLVWLDSIRTLGASKGSPGGLYIKGKSGGSELHKLSDFHLSIKKSEFFKDFKTIDNPDGVVVNLGDDRVPKTAWQFDFNMTLKPYGWREKAARGR
jgi:Tfp pilus assembly protein PilN